MPTSEDTSNQNKAPESWRTHCWLDIYRHLHFTHLADFIGFASPMPSWPINSRRNVLKNLDKHVQALISYLLLASSCRTCFQCAAVGVWSSHIPAWWLPPHQWRCWHLKRHVQKYPQQSRQLHLCMYEDQRRMSIKENLSSVPGKRRKKKEKKGMAQFEKRGSPHTNVERTSPGRKLGKAFKNWRKKKKKKKWMLQLTEVNVSKRTTPYLSPEPVLVPNSQLHASNLSLSQWENTDIKIKQQTYKLSIIAPLSPLQL